MNIFVPEVWKLTPSVETMTNLQHEIQDSSKHSNESGIPQSHPLWGKRINLSGQVHATQRIPQWSIKRTSDFHTCHFSDDHIESWLRPGSLRKPTRMNYIKIFNGVLQSTAECHFNRGDNYPCMLWPFTPAISHKRLFLWNDKNMPDIDLDNATEQPGRNLGFIRIPYSHSW